MELVVHLVFQQGGLNLQSEHKGTTALHLAAGNGHGWLCELLVTFEANCNLETWTPGKEPKRPMDMATSGAAKAAIRTGGGIPLITKRPLASDN